jgi:hypothetical protein
MIAGTGNTNKKSSSRSHEKSITEKRELIDKLKNSLINSTKNKKDKKDIEFLLRRL